MMSHGWVRGLQVWDIELNFVRENEGHSALYIDPVLTGRLFLCAQMESVDASIVKK